MKSNTSKGLISGDRAASGPSTWKTRRTLTSLLTALGLLLPYALMAPDAPIKGTPPQGTNKPRVAVNRTVPLVEAPSGTLKLSVQPTTKELTEVRFFNEPLVPIGGEPDAAENRVLSGSLVKHAERAESDDCSSLEDFVAAHPRGKWGASVYFNLGTEYFTCGYWSKALGAWQKAGKLSSNATEPKAKALADRAAGDWAMLYARLGRMTDLESILKSLENRTIIGSASEKIAGAKQGLWSMKNVPGISFRCGPLALDRIRTSENPNLAANPHIQDAQSTTNGFSLVH